MMEFYELTVLQLDAIGRVCDCATENESEYIRFVEMARVKQRIDELLEEGELAGTKAQKEN